MSANSQHYPARVRGRSAKTGTLAFKTMALVVVATLAVLLWQLAVPRVIALAGGHDAGSRTVDAVVSACAGMDDCTVQLTDPAGAQRTLPLTDPGMFRVGVADHLTVRVDPSGQVAVAGWQAWLDASILLVLAIALTCFAIGWWKRVLQHSDIPYDGGEPHVDLDVGIRHPRRV